jgi:hypothetical protein
MIGMLPQPRDSLVRKQKADQRQKAVYTRETVNEANLSNCALTISVHCDKLEQNMNKVTSHFERGTHVPSRETPHARFTRNSLS